MEADQSSVSKSIPINPATRGHHTSPVFSFVKQHRQLQQESLNFIASENYTYPEVLQVLGSCLTDKYASGTPTSRVYSGCTVLNKLETYGCSLVQEIFPDAEFVNIQPHSGSLANYASYFSLLKPNDTILYFETLGHFTHGHPENLSGKIFNCVPYCVDPVTHALDYSVIETIAKNVRPKLIVAGASAYAGTIDFERFAYIAQKVGAYLLCDIAHIAGPVIAGLHPNPVKYADIVTMTTHKTLRGPRGGIIISKKQYRERIEKVMLPGLQAGPLMNNIAAKVIAFEKALEPSFVSYQKHVIENAQTLAHSLQDAGLSICGGTTYNHSFLLDLCSMSINGTQAEHVLESAGILTNRYHLPFDPNQKHTSGIRFGTPAVTTRGMKPIHMKLFANYIHEILQDHENIHLVQTIKDKIQKICYQFPLPY